jgi:hypothetical protein
MRHGRIFSAGLLLGILKSIWGALTCGWMFSWVYRLEPAVVWSPMEEFPVGLCIAMTLIFSIIFAYVFYIVMDGLPGRDTGKGLWFGLFVWLIGGLPGISVLFLSTVIAHTVLIYWLVSALIVSLWSGVVVAKIIK